MPTPDRIKQVETTRRKYGTDYYSQIGYEGGKKSTTKFTSETARLAAQAKWAKYREEQKNIKENK